MAVKKTRSGSTLAAAKTLATATARRSSASRPRSDRKRSEAADKVVTIDRRRGSRRTEEAVKPIEEVPSPKLERREKTQRRRQIDPTTCERDYSEPEIEFMNAMDEYKRKNGRMFPTCSEVLEVIRGLGYVKLSPAGRAMMAEYSREESAAIDELSAADEALALERLPD